MATKIKLIADNVITTSQIDTSSLDSHFTGGTGVTYSSGTISIGQAVHSTDSPTFADLTLTGNLNITGDINSYNVTDLDVTDQTITLGAGQTEALSGGSGIIVDGSNASILWDETNDTFDFNKGIELTASTTAIKLVDADNTLVYHEIVNDSNTGLSIKVDQGNANGSSYFRTLIDGSEYLRLTPTDLELKSNIAFTKQDGMSISGLESIQFKINSAGGLTGRVFQFNDNTTGLMALDQNGNLGIGTVNISHNLHVKDLTGNATARIEGASNSYKGTLLVSSAGSGDGGIQYDANTNKFHQFSYGDMIFYAGTGNLSGAYPANERMRIYQDGIIGINKPSGPAVGGFGTPAIVVKQWVDSEWGGINIEANGNDSVFSFSNSDTSHIIAGSYRSTAGYKDIVIKAGGGERLKIGQAGKITFPQGQLEIQNTGNYEIEFVGSNSTNIRSERAIYHLADRYGNSGDAYYGIGFGNDNGVIMLGRNKTSTGTNGSATGYYGVSFGNNMGSTTLGNYNGIEPMAPFHILKGGLTMNGFESAGVARYLHSASDSGQWMHMNTAGRSGSGVGNFELYVPTAQSTGSWGSFGGDLFLSGYNGQHEYIIWRGYTNSGLAGASGTVVSGTGSPTITVGQNGAFGFYIRVSNISMTHPIAMYRVCKGGQGGREWDLSEISCRWF